MNFAANAGGVCIGALILGVIVLVVIGMNKTDQQVTITYPTSLDTSRTRAADTHDWRWQSRQSYSADVDPDNIPVQVALPSVVAAPEEGFMSFTEYLAERDTLARFNAAPVPASDRASEIDLQPLSAEEVEPEAGPEPEPEPAHTRPGGWAGMRMDVTQTGRWSIMPDDEGDDESV